MVKKAVGNLHEIRIVNTVEEVAVLFDAVSDSKITDPVIVDGFMEVTIIRSI